MKRKTITLVIYMLVCISLVSVGFAAWVITGGDNTQATGNVTASTVTDKSLHTSETVTFVSGKQNINFGSPIDESGNAINNDATNWFQFDTADPENLVAIYYFDLWVGNGTENDASIASTVKQVKLTYTDSAVDSLISSNYVKAPVFSAWWGDGTEGSPCVTPTEEAGFATALKTALTTTESTAVSSSSVKIYIKIEYDWGSVFNKKNPYEFFNSVSSGSVTYSDNNTPDDETDDITYKDLAIDALGAIDAAFQTAAELKDEPNSGYEYTMVLNFESVAEAPAN